MKPKHILIIMTDQCRADALGVYGNTYAQTPAIDEIAKGAAVFNRAVTPSPVCVPARLSLLAGQYVNRTGNSNNNPKTCYTGEGFYSMLTKAGFESCCVGKMHHVWDRYGLMGFGERHTQEEMAQPDDDYTKFIKNSPYKNVFDYNGQRSDMYYVPQISQLPAEAHPTQWIGDRSVEFIEKCDPEKPMFLMSSFIHPHPPFCPPAPWNKLFREIPEAPFVPEETPELKYLLPPAFDLDTRLDMSDTDIRRAKNFYYACVSFMDYQIGRITDALKAKGMYDDTVILFISDHGETLGDYRHVGKRTMLSCANRIPFILRVPGMEGGERVDPVSLVDVAPTLLSLFGVDYDPAEFDGIDILSGKHSEVYSQYECGEKACYMVAGADDKLIYNAANDKYAYFTECPEHIDRYAEGGERVEYLKTLLDAHIAADKCPEAKNPNKGAGKAEKKEKVYDFAGDRMDHKTRRAEEAARIPAPYKIDLRRFVGDDPV
ncbi:MAG: sulfatase-like hydrolase/transferase [Clostridia bacterium]|nr:sulfatase-like hydrolase/transferase [Clostridia bacterium]